MSSGKEVFNFWMISGWFVRYLAGLWVVSGWFGSFVGGLRMVWQGLWMVWMVFVWFRILQPTKIS